MAPKEKAEELINKMYYTQSSPTSWNQAQQCTLIAVDEIIKTLNYDIKDLDVRGNILLDLIKYWREVKQEIEKL